MDGMERRGQEAVPENLEWPEQQSHPLKIISIALIAIYSYNVVNTATWKISDVP